MASTYSRKAFPNRILRDYDSDPQRGDDIKVVRRHVLKRLEARDIKRKVGPGDGRYRKELHEAAKTAAHFLGVPEEWTESDSGLLVREQRVIVYPATRTQAMLDAAEARMENMLEERAKAEKEAKARKAKPGSNSEKDRSEARRIAVAAFRLAYNHRGIVHYTQGPSRWQGIRERRRYGDGRFPTYADCSSMATWALWNALTNIRGMNTADVVNGSGWRAGYTGTLLSHGVRVTGERLPGDLVIYGRGFPGHHVAMCASNPDMVYSHGSESGPHYLRWNYRSDVMSVRRYIR